MTPHSLFPPPICAVCDVPIPSGSRHLRDELLGRICIPCASEHIPLATVALSRAGLYVPLRHPKNSKPRQTSK